MRRYYGPLRTIVERYVRIEGGPKLLFVLECGHTESRPNSERSHLLKRVRCRHCGYAAATTGTGDRGVDLYDPVIKKRSFTLPLLDI